MAEEEAFLFPVLVEGDWASRLSKSLKNKLLCYFQSRKKSGGGECKIHAGQDEQITVYFAEDKVRQRVLGMKNHELILQGKETLKLTLSLPAVATDENESQEPNPNQESIEVNQPQESSPNFKAAESDLQARGEAGAPASQPETDSSALTEEDQESHPSSISEEKACFNEEMEGGDCSSSPESAAGDKTKQEEFRVEIVTAAGEEIEEDIVEMYFENKRRSGGGPIKSCVKDGQRLIITFEKEEDAQAVLQRKNHLVKKIALHVRECPPETTQPQMLTSLVVLENVQETIDQCMLILLVENVSGLSEDDRDFSVEMIPEKNAAVITLIKPNDLNQFIKAFNEHHRVKQLKMSASFLEMTRSILVENIPSDIARDFITFYFESKKHGGGPVSEANYLSKENSAIITFQYNKDVVTVLAQKHYFNKQLVFVHPYYESLGTALYGKARPQCKMPEPIRISLDLYHWQYLQRNRHLLEEIDREMAKYCCEIQWPIGHCPHPGITICPSHSLFKQKRSLARTWNEDASSQFAQILSRHKVVKCKVTAEVWEAIRNSVVKDNILVFPDIEEGIVALVGAAEDVNGAEQEVKVLIGNAVKKFEREMQAIEVILTVDAVKYTILKNAGLLDSIGVEYPDLKVSYDNSKECIILFGLPAEAFKIKSDILERISSMAQKTIDVHAYVLIFLQHVDNENVSRILFWTKRINAFYELKEKEVQLRGITPHDLQQAEEEIKKDLDYKCVELEDNSIIRKREWRELTDSLYKAHNCSGEAIVINELEDRVVIAGYFREVASAAQKLCDFVDRNTYIQKTIKTNSEVVTMYIEKEKRDTWQSLVQRGVKIDFGTRMNRRLITLDGPRVEMSKGLELMKNLLSSLSATRMVVDKPGAKSSFKEQEHLYITGAKQQFNCLIRLQEDGEELEKDDGNESVHEGCGKLCCEVKMANGIVVAVCKGDLTRYPADVVVNASNEDLKHIGGLADALLKAAGPELQRECDEFVRKNGPLEPGCAVVTGAGNLPCKQLIHAVGPRWKSFEKEKCMLLLKKAVRESLQLAISHNYCSIAMPAISSGIFGFPLKECAQSIVTAIKETVQESTGTGSLKKIDLVDFKENTVQALTDALNEAFRNGSSPSRDRSSASNSETDNQPNQPSQRIVHQGITTSEGLRIILHRKGIEEATTDVVVNSVSRDLSLDKGLLSKALLGKAGPGLQEELVTQGQGRTIAEGCVFKTKGYGLGCSFVLHAVLPVWAHGQKSEDKNLGKIIDECLTITEQHFLTSITIPAVGTGNLGFPKPLVAKLMFDEVFKFSQKKNPTALQEVHFVLHPSDTDTIKAFTDELNLRLGMGHNSVSVSKPLLENSQEGQALSGVSVTTAGVHEMQIGSVTFQVVCGDITQEATDVIVNITNITYNSKEGVSRAILEGAGREVQTECLVLALQPHKNVICTQGGNLRCKNIIHLVANNDIKAQVSKALMECEQRWFTSVAFPAIGTGKAARDPAAVADDMIDAIVEYAGKTSAPVVTMIKIVIFQPHLVNAFYTSMQKKEGALSKPGASPQKSIFFKVAEFFGFNKPTTEAKPVFLLESSVKPAIFQICGDSQKNVEKAESWIRELILKNQNEITVSDEWISSFREKEYEKLRELQMKLHVVIQQGTASSLRIGGLTRDVLSANIEIQQLIQRVRKAHEEQSKANLLSNLVEWQYEDSGHYKTFDNMSSMHIEVALQNKSTHDLTIRNKRYRVDPAQQWARDDQGRSINIKRIAKTEDKSVIALPEEWGDMKQKRVIAVELNPGVKEYQDVHQMFSQTCQSFTVEKIERIQNPYYWQAYQIKKQEMDAKNGTTNNEKRLFHGTARSSLTLINNSGFNRSYAGVHAAAYGNGTYFAVNANYSAQDTYSTRDEEGKKYMYLARVLVGEYCVGSAGLVVPKAKSKADPTNLYDSVTDNMKRPSMFVIFNDIQAYPEYLITFK